jgi:N-acetylglucosamine-6-phosphate deacetylase
MPTTTSIVADRIFDGISWHSGHRLVCAAGLVRAIETQATPGDGCTETTIELPTGAVLVPGFIDIQVNGGGGVLLNDQLTLAGIAAIAATHRRFGTTGLLPTLITDTPAALTALLAIAEPAMAIPGVLGFHLEGPFLNPMRKGVHRADLIRPPTAADIAQLMQLARFGRCVVTLAPEVVPTAQLQTLLEAGVILSAGHSAATAAEMAAAVEHGLTGVTHLFNAMSQIGPREGGVVGAACDDPRLFAGIIADGQHVAAANLRLALRQKTPDRLLLVTDAMPTAGTALTTFNLQGRQIQLTGDRLTSADGTLAGAHLTMNRALQRFLAATGVELDSGLICASRTPAAYLGLAATHGGIRQGMRADCIALDPVTFEVLGTWIGGVGGLYV